MKWLFIGDIWYDENGGMGQPPALPAANPQTQKPWRNNDAFDDNPPPAAPFVAGTWTNGDYALPHPHQATFSIVIDSHQKKHQASWPGNYGGSPGTKFPLTDKKSKQPGWNNDDVIAYAQLVIARVPQFLTAPAGNIVLPNVSVHLQYQPVGKQAVASVLLNSPAWDAGDRFWSFHFYPA